MRIAVSNIRGRLFADVNDIIGFILSYKYDDESIDGAMNALAADLRHLQEKAD